MLEPRKIRSTLRPVIVASSLLALLLSTRLLQAQSGASPAAESPAAPVETAPATSPEARRAPEQPAAAEPAAASTRAPRSRARVERSRYVVPVLTGLGVLAVSLIAFAWWRRRSAAAALPAPLEAGLGDARPAPLPPVGLFSIPPTRSERDSDPASGDLAASLLRSTLAPPPSQRQWLSQRPLGFKENAR